MAKRNRISLRTLFWLLCTLVWCGVIFHFSAQDATDSNQASDSVLRKIMEVCTGWIPADAADVDSDSHIVVAFIVRKIAHFTLYFILGLFSSATVFSDGVERNRKLGRCWLCAWGFCIFYAATDEFHQLFVSGRTGRPLDVCIDSSGALLSSLIVFFFVYRAVRRRQIAENGV